MNNNPDKKMRWLFIAPGNLAGDFSNVPLGIGILASLLESRKIFVCVKDYSIEPLIYDELRETIEKEGITHIGLTMMTCQATVAYEIAGFIERTFQGRMIIVSGGIHPTLLPKESLDNKIELVYRDEAETSFMRSLAAIETRPFDYGLLKDIPGLSFYENGGYVDTGNALRTTDLDSLPLPAYHLFKFPEGYSTQFVYKKGHSSNLITSRGCTGHCVFCSKHYQGVYFQSAERVVEQFVFLKERYNISQIFVQDDLFTYDLGRVERICDLLIREKVDMPWICSNTRADSITFELMQKMRRSGCISVAFGVESGNEKVRKKIGKMLNAQDVFNAVGWARKAGLLTSAFYIFGNLNETYADALETIEFAKRLDTDTVTFSINCPYPGTPLRAILLKKGIQLTEDWGRYRTWGEPLFETEYLTKKDMVGLQKLAYRKYYRRPKYLFRQARNMVVGGHFYMYWHGFKWLLEQYFDYKMVAKNKPLHILDEKPDH